MYYEIPDCTGPLKDVLREYVVFKRSLGYDYGKAILYRLREIDLFFKASGVTKAEITEDMFERWARKRGYEGAVNRRRRVGTLIELSKFMASRGYENVFIGDMAGLPRGNRFIPYIFTRAEIDAIFHVLRSRVQYDPLDTEAATFSMMICLYYGCGLRKTEVQKLKIGDVDTSAGSIRVMESKNRESRLVIVSESIRRQLSSYCSRYRYGFSDGAHLFEYDGAMFGDYRLYSNYSRTLAAAGIGLRENGKLPRIHDLRHTFCVHTLEAMAQKGFDLYVSLPLLVAYLGHRCIFETEYYLRLVDENFSAVTSASKRYAPSLFPKVGDACAE